jgi:hypothetical protein
METDRQKSPNLEETNPIPTKVNSCSKFYQNFILYLPVILLLSLILLIYFTYVFLYLRLLLDSSAYDKLSFPFISTTNLKSATNKGIILLSAMSFMILCLLVSLMRVVVMDPGYLPDPLDLELKLVKKLTYKSFVPDAKKEKKKRLLTKNFSKIVTTAPVTYHEMQKLNQNINYYLSDNLFIEMIREPRLQLKQLINLQSEEEDKNLKKEETCENDLFNLDDIFENFKSEELGTLPLCNACLRWKVDRSHHCRQCGKCVLKMDHHCPWLANCIGFKNYKYFCLISIYGVMSTMFVTFTFWEAILHYYSKGSILLSSFIIYVYLCNIGLMVFSFWLFFYNWNLVFNNLSLIEKCDRDKFISSKKSWINEYDQGCYNNFVAVFGNNPLIWFLPIYANYEGEGIAYKKCFRI